MSDFVSPALEEFAKNLVTNLSKSGHSVVSQQLGIKSARGPGRPPKPKPDIKVNALFTIIPHRF